MTVTLKFQSSGTMPGDARPVSMQGGSMTVGRGPANDMVLPDPDRLLSKNHFVIEDHNGNVVVVDLSTNGTFLNYSKIPLGRTPTPLNNGDVLTVGNYELVVQIAGDVPDFDDLIAPPAAAGGISHGDASRAPDPLDLLDAPGPGGDFLDSLLGPESKPTGPSQFNPVDPIDELLPPMGEDEDPFFQKTPDGREGEGASLPSHSAGIHDSYRPGASGGGQNLIPDDWDDLLGG
ncbi:MAG: FHA domain-containing protein, partial [Pseudooceanicola sp.]|nr:FHA domain-containing protein [Pseudooceanicola sp.]